MNNIRMGKGYKWKSSTTGPKGAQREVEGFIVDDLDSKKMADAKNDYEKTFILIRTILEEKSAYCMDDESERLQCVQTITDTLLRKD